MKRDTLRLEHCDEDNVADLFDAGGEPSNNHKHEARNTEKSAAVAGVLAALPDSLLVEELWFRGYIVTDLDTLDKLHDGYWTDPNADARVREWIRKATGRL